MLWLATNAIRRLVDRVPIRSAVNEVRGRDRVLKKLCPAVVVAMGVRNDDVFDLVHIEAKLLHPAGNFVRRGIVIERVEDDDAFAANEGPGVVKLGAEEVE